MPAKIVLEGKSYNKLSVLEDKTIHNQRMTVLK